MGLENVGGGRQAFETDMETTEIDVETTESDSEATGTVLIADGWMKRGMRRG
jgi:hypothetical protein